MWRAGRVEGDAEREPARCERRLDGIERLLAGNADDEALRVDLDRVRGGAHGARPAHAARAAHDDTSVICFACASSTYGDGDGGGKRLPGFKMPFGSNTRISFLTTSTPPAPSSCAMRGAFERPTP